MSQVINNLVINADHAMPEGGHLRIRAENHPGGSNSVPLKHGKYVRISFEDQGVGIPTDYLSKIFDPYFTTKQKGSGLGLATCYSIIKQHEGHISVDSELGKGTTFCIYLTASQHKIEEDEKRLAATQRQEPVRKGKILLMDDEEAIRKSVSRMLTRIGYEVELAEEGVEAIQLYKKAQESGAPFNAVLMDLTIPGGMGGKEAIQKLMEIDSNIKAIVSSGYSNDPVMAEYSKYGFTGMVAKPYQLEQLYQVLQNVVSDGKS